MTDQRDSIEPARPGAGETEELPLIVPEQPPMDDAAGGPTVADEEPD